MLTLLRLLAFFVGAVLVVTFAVANRDPIVIEFFPLPLTPVQIPVYGLFLVALSIGALLGAVSMWLSALPLRADHRRLRRQIQSMESELRQDRLREEEAATQRSQRRKEREDEPDKTALPLGGPGLGDANGPGSPSAPRARPARFPICRWTPGYRRGLAPVRRRRPPD